MKRFVAGTLAILAWSGSSFAQDWPTRPVTMVVPYTAGGPVDTVSRILAARLSETLGPVSYTHLTLPTIYSV